jgi:serine/threonine protein phosphatase 1
MNRPPRPARPELSDVFHCDSPHGCASCFAQMRCWRGTSWVLINYFLIERDNRRQILSPYRSRPSKGKPKLPEGVRIYAMTDIHGCAHLLKQMLRVIDADLARSRPRYAIEVYMGDYVDRGPDSRATLDILISRSRRGNTVFLKGNHEVFLGNVLRDPSLLTEWLHVGGLYTLMSCGLTPSPTPGDEERRALVREFARDAPPAP